MGHPVRLLFQEVNQVDSNLFEEAYDLYDRAFPVIEKESPQVFRKWLENHNAGKLPPGDTYHILTARKDVNEPVAGVAIFYYINAIESGFLDYLAIRPGSRSKGYGAQLFQEVKELLREYHKPVKHIFTELEVLCTTDSLTKDRLRFWERQNMLPLDMHWQYPVLWLGSVSAPTYLAHCPIKKTVNHLDVDEVLEAVIAIYTSIYHKGFADLDRTTVIRSLLERVTNQVQRCPVTALRERFN